MDTGAARNAPASASVSRGRPILHLGVLVQPYYRRGMTTYDVAQILEKKYGIMSAFWRVRGQEATGHIVQSLLGALESHAMGQRVDPFGSAMQQVEQMFRTFISSQEAERVGIPGTPTKAALRGVNHRFRHPYARSNPRRPSFRDTGMYLNSFRSWID